MPRRRVLYLLLACLLLGHAGCGSKINEANYYKVGLGDSEESVEEQLGPGRPLQIDVPPGSGRSAKQWERGKLKITVIFEQGKVIARSAEGLSTGSEDVRMSGAGPQEF